MDKRLSSRRLSRKAAIIMLSIIVMLQMFPMQIFAEGESLVGTGSTIYYTTASGGVDSTTEYTLVQSGATTLTTGTYVVDGAVTISNSNNNCLNCNGDIQLILLDGASLTVNSLLGTAVSVPTGSSLTITAGSDTSSTIEGTGTLTCKGKDGTIGKNTRIRSTAGIGYGHYDSEEDCYVGDIVINGGNVNAYGADSEYPGPGIGAAGGDPYKYGAEVSGTLTVNGGNVTVKAGSYTGQGYVLGNSAIALSESGFCQGIYVNGGEMYVESSGGYPAIIYGYVCGCKEVIVGNEVGIVGEETTAVDHSDKDVSETLSDYSKLRFVGGVHYTDGNGKEHTLPGKKLTADSTTMDATAADAYCKTFFTNEDLTINNTLTVKGDAKLIVADGKTLTVNGASGAGINVGSGNSLTVEAGTVVANGGSSSGAGIGTNVSKPCGAITIKSGNITATGSGSSPGIGGGSTDGSNGTITINTCSVTTTVVNATGGSGGGSGIGGAKNASGEIVINGGNVTATGQAKGAGIGGSTDLAVTINGGTIIANGGNSSGSSGAGIGGCYDTGNGNITINKGSVTATGGNGAAGIGAGKGNQTNPSGKTITINGGKVTTQGGYEAAGIGGGYKGQASEVVINNGTVKSTGGTGGAGIGNGKLGKATNVTINKGTVTATGGANGAGIGSGINATCGTITLNSGLIKATAGNNASAIGGGNGGTAGTVIADAEEFIWAAANETDSKKLDAAVSNDGDNLYSVLAGKKFAYANHVLNSEGFNFETYIGTKVPKDDRETIENNLNNISVTVKDRVKRKDAQLEILERVVADQYPEKSETEVKEYINDILRAGKTVKVGINVDVTVKNSNLSGGDEAFIEYKLDPTAIVSGAINGSCELTIEDFRSQSIALEVTMPTCGSFTPASVSHTSDDGNVNYETFSADGTKKFSYNSATKTVTVAIEHCSNLRINAKGAVNTGDTTSDDMLPYALMMMLSILGLAGYGLKRREK